MAQFVPKVSLWTFVLWMFKLEISCWAPWESPPTPRAGGFPGPVVWGGLSRLTHRVSPLLLSGVPSLSARRSAAPAVLLHSFPVAVPPSSLELSLAQPLPCHPPHCWWTGGLSGRKLEQSLKCRLIHEIRCSWHEGKQSLLSQGVSLCS